MSKKPPKRSPKRTPSPKAVANMIAGMAPKPSRSYGQLADELLAGIATRSDKPEDVHSHIVFAASSVVDDMRKLDATLNAADTLIDEMEYSPPRVSVESLHSALLGVVAVAHEQIADTLRSAQLLRDIGEHLCHFKRTEAVA